ncbi:MAG: carboxypeptidase-like regulatory domain-containing protein [Acidobacteriota bacterium]
MNSFEIVRQRTAIFVACSAMMAQGVLAAGQANPQSDVIRASVTPAEASIAAVETGESAAAAAVEGTVIAQARPLAKATVYAYEVATYALKKVSTDQAGRFLFRSLPAGMYKVIAFKEGFAPTMELLMHRRDQDRQYLEIVMRDEKVGDTRQAEDYWSVRSRVPTDVLREIQSLLQRQENERLKGAARIAGLSQFEGEMLADGGQLALAHGEALLTGAQVDLQGVVGEMQLGFNGTYRLLEPAAVLGYGSMPDAEQRSMAFSLENTGSSKLSFAYSSGQLATVHDGRMTPVEMEHGQVQWSGQVGQSGRSQVVAQYTDEANYHRGGWVDPIDIPEASRTLNFEGSYSTDLTKRTSLQTGASFRQRVGENPYFASLTGAPLTGAEPLVDERLGVFGLAGSKIRPGVMVEYGLYSSVQDGSLSLMPHGGIVVNLGSDWQARGSFARRLDSQDPTTYRGFSSSAYSDTSTCREAGEACYEVYFSRGGEPDDSISIGAVHREYAETLRLYFSPDFFNRLESLFVVQGDELPELQFSMVRRIAPKVLAKLESNIASGGGGIFYATDDLPYENEVRYLVTSLDTQFQNTSTGVFVAFHHLEQALNPASDQVSGSLNEVEMQRLQLMLTQDLDILADFASNWAVRFNVELSRGATPYTLATDDELRKKLTGGISVSF